jgi:hypothetical protein
MVFVCGGGPAPEVLTSLDTNHRISFLPNHHSLPKTEKKKKKEKKEKKLPRVQTSLYFKYMA